MKTPLRGDFTVNKVQHSEQFDYLSFIFTRKCAKNIEGRVDFGSTEVRNDKGSNSPMKRCELTEGLFSLKKLVLVYGFGLKPVSCLITNA